MPSPFPGMDPYIESAGYWGEFHTTLVVAIRDALNSAMPKGFAATIDVYVWIHEPTAERRVKRIKPDAYVAKTHRPSSSTSALAARTTATQIVLPGVERRRRRYIKVEDLERERVVTAIELLSPSNKLRGEDHDVYMTKRNEYIANRISLVEIDLLRSGGRLPLGDSSAEGGDFYVLASKAWEYPRADFWSFTLHDALPTVTVPIIEDVRAVPLDLQSCFASAYERCLYDVKLRYDRPLMPRPRRSDAAWIKNLLPSTSQKST